MRILTKDYHLGVEDGIANKKLQQRKRLSGLMRS